MFIVLFVSNNIFSQIWNPPLIPPGDRVDWTTAGLTIQRPVDFNLIIDVTKPPYNVTPSGSATNNTAGFLAAITDARSSQGWKVIYFSQPGTYNFNGTIALGTADNNLVIKGIGSDKVILFFQTGSSADHCFSITGNSTGTTTPLMGSYVKDNDILTLASARTDLNIGDCIELLDDLPTNYQWATVGQVIQIKAKISDTQYQLADKLSMDYPAGYSPRIQKFIPVQNIGFEDIKVQRSTSDGAANAGRNFYFNNAVNCWLYGVESHGTVSWHVDISASSHIFIHGCFFHHANAYGNPEGTGYGVVCENRSTNCLIENNIFNYLRHAMLVESSANRNVYSFNYDYVRNYDWAFELPPWTSDPNIGPADIAVHGTYAHANLFESNFVELIYEDGSHGNNGQYNTFFRNRVWNDDAQQDGYIFVENGGNTNVIANSCIYATYPLSTTVLDIFGMFYGDLANHPDQYSLITHLYEHMHPVILPTTICNDDSYYLNNRPSWLDDNYYSYPAEGTTYLMGHYLTNSIPARDRKLSGGKFTLTGSPVLFPLSAVSISGSISLPIGQNGTWNASLTNGFPPFSYQWYYEYPGGVQSALAISPNLLTKGVWYTCGTNSATLATAFYASIYLKCIVTDAHNTVVTSNQMTVSIGAAKAVANLSPTLGSEQPKVLSTPLPKFYAADQNYPNPFNPTTVINYQLPKDGFVSLKVYDVVGNVVKTLVSGYKLAGSYTSSFEASNLASGMYFYRIVAGDFVSVKKMLLLK